MQRHFVISKHELDYCSYTLIHDLRSIGEVRSDFTFLLSAAPSAMVAEKRPADC